MIVGLLLLTLPVGHAAATDKALAGLAGTFVYVGGPTEKASIQAAIDKALGDLVFLARPFARGRLEETNKPIAQVTIGHEGGDLVVTYNNESRAASPSNGTSIDWKSPIDDKIHKLSTKVQGGKLIQTFVGDDGTRRNTFSVKNGGKSLEMVVRVSSPHLPTTIEYSLTYARR